MRHRSNYDWMLFLTSTMAFVGVGTHDFVFTIIGKRSNPCRPRAAKALYYITFGNVKDV